MMPKMALNLLNCGRECNGNLRGVNLRGCQRHCKASQLEPSAKAGAIGCMGYDLAESEDRKSVV